MRAVAKNLGLKIKPVVLKSSLGSVDWGSLVNDTWTGILGHVARGTVDTACMLYRSSPERLATFDFTEPIFKTRTGVAVRRQEHLESGTFWDYFHSSHGFWDFFHPFSPRIWLSLILAVFLQCASGVLIAKTEGRMLGFDTKPLDIAFLVVRLQLRQPVFEVLPLRTAGKIWLTAFSLVQCMLLTTLYQTVFRASSILRPQIPPFTSYEQVVTAVEQGRYRIAEYTNGDWFTEQIEHSGEERFARLREAVAKNPILHMNSANETLGCVRAGRCIQFMQYDQQIRYMAKITDCDVSFVYDDFPSVEPSFVFRKGSPFSAAFSAAIEQERIEIGRLQRKYYETMYERIRDKRCGMKTFRLLPNIGLLAQSKMDANFTPASTAAPYAGRCPENSLSCARILSPAEVLVIAVDIPVLLFHASVFYFILRQITGNKKDFRSAFYRLYAAMSVVDVIHTLDVYICLRLPVYGIFLDFWESSVVVASAGYLISGYCVYYQFFSHLTIALNRFSVFAFPQSYKKVWTKKNVYWAIVVNSLLPFPFLSFRLPASVRYLYVGANSMGVRYLDPNIRKVSFRA